MEFNSKHRESPIKKFVPKKPVNYNKQEKTKAKVWWEQKNTLEKIKSISNRELSLAEKVLQEEKEAKLKKDSCIDSAIENYNVELSQNAKILVKYMEKYLQKDKSLFKKIEELDNKPEIKGEFSEYEWALLIEQAWILAYRKAMDDEYITLEERHELNNLYSLGKRYKNNLFYQPQLKRQLIDKFKVLNAIDAKYAIENKYDDGELWMKKYDSVPRQTKHYRRLPKPRPKLTPYSDGEYGYR